MWCSVPREAQATKQWKHSIRCTFCALQSQSPAAAREVHGPKGGLPMKCITFPP